MSGITNVTVFAQLDYPSTSSVYPHLVLYIYGHDANKNDKFL